MAYVEKNLRENEPDEIIFSLLKSRSLKKCTKIPPCL